MSLSSIFGWISPIFGNSSNNAHRSNHHQQRVAPMTPGSGEHPPSTPATAPPPPSSLSRLSGGSSAIGAYSGQPSTPATSNLLPLFVTPTTRTQPHHRRQFSPPSSTSSEYYRHTTAAAASTSHSSSHDHSHSHSRSRTRSRSNSRQYRRRDYRSRRDPRSSQAATQSSRYHPHSDRRRSHSHDRRSRSRERDHSPYQTQQARRRSDNNYESNYYPSSQRNQSSYRSSASTVAAAANSSTNSSSYYTPQPSRDGYFRRSAMTTGSKYNGSRTARGRSISPDERDRERDRHHRHRRHRHSSASTSPRAIRYSSASSSRSRSHSPSSSSRSRSRNRRHHHRDQHQRRRSPSYSPESESGRSSASPSGSSSSSAASHSASASHDGVDSGGSDNEDNEGVIDIAVGSIIKGRYEVLSVAGKGTFGTVLDVLDKLTQQRLALKIVRSVPRYLEAAQVEVEILERIRAADLHDRSLCVKYIKQFNITHHGQTHVVLAFEKLGRSLFAFIKKNGYRGFSLKHVAEFGYQLLTAVAFCHRIQLIHTDLKPENILLRHSDYRIVKNYSRYREETSAAKQIQSEEEAKRKQRRRLTSMISRRGGNYRPNSSSSSTTHKNNGEESDDSQTEDGMIADAVVERMKGKDDTNFREPIDTSIRLIDFGGATFEYEHHSQIVNTRQYRAPEVLLGCGWSYPSDLWSIGWFRMDKCCILPELYTGELLFGTHEDLEHLALMEKILEQPLPDSLTRLAIAPYQKAHREQAARRGESIVSARTSSGGGHHRSYDDSHHTLHRHHQERDVTSPSPASHRSSSERSSSSPRADLLLNIQTGKLKWPQGAKSEKSIKTVKQAQTLSQLLPDPDFLDLIQRLLTYDPARRITAEQALQHPFFRQVRFDLEQRQQQAEQAAMLLSASETKRTSSCPTDAFTSRSYGARERGLPPPPPPAALLYGSTATPPALNITPSRSNYPGSSSVIASTAAAYSSTATSSSRHSAKRKRGHGSRHSRSPSGDSGDDDDDDEVEIIERKEASVSNSYRRHPQAAASVATSLTATRWQPRSPAPYSFAPTNAAYDNQEDERTRQYKRSKR